MPASSSSFSSTNSVENAAVPPILVWEGEWSRVKSCITSVREIACSTANRTYQVADFSSYLSLFRGCSRRTEEYVSSLVGNKHDELHRYEWFGRGVGIVTASTYIMAKSTTLGPYKMVRNGLLTAMFLTSFLFPAEISQALSKTVWFSSRGIES